MSFEADLDTVLSEDHVLTEAISGRLQQILQKLHQNGGLQGALNGGVTRAQRALTDLVQGKPQSQPQSPQSQQQSPPPLQPQPEMELAKRAMTQARSAVSDAAEAIKTQVQAQSAQNPGMGRLYNAVIIPHLRRIFETIKQAQTALGQPQSASPPVQSVSQEPN